MKHIEFISIIIQFYGKYNSTLIEKLTMDYIKDRWKESDLESIFKQLILKKSSQFKTPPDPANFEELFPRQNLDILASKWFNDLTRTGNSLDNVIISDIRAQKAVESFGGWPEFCKRNPENEIWDRKKFVEMFKSVRQNEPARILYGESSRMLEKQPLMFGDKESCLKILSD